MHRRCKGVNEPAPPGRCRLIYTVATSVHIYSGVTIIKLYKHEHGAGRDVTFANRFYPPPYSPKPVRYPFQGGVKIRNIKSMPPSGNTRQPLDDKPGGSQLVSAGKKMGPRRETSIVGKHKPPFHGVPSACEGEQRHHLVLARPVRFLTNVAHG